MTERILLFDTSQTSENLGDYIIMDSVNKELRELFPEDLLIRTPTHDTVGKFAHSWGNRTKLKFVGGSNLLSGRFTRRDVAQWRFGFHDANKIHGIIGIALGWQSYRQYNRLIDQPFVAAQKHLYRKSLSSKYLHSVRDSYTQKKLEEYGFQSINTACVTMWRLDIKKLNQLPLCKANKVVTTITDYRNDEQYIKAYESMLTTLLKTYNQVALWIQAPPDKELIDRLNIPNKSRIQLINPSLEAYDEVLSEDVDYVGTRLHAGIRALQHNRRATIIEVDNRATEIAKDTNLPVLSMKNIDRLKEVVEHPTPIDLHIPFDEIKRWKQQFSPYKDKE
ncbi:polysaccharide pyruvyl transferase family protein [Latilactobacillus curvatus]|uniref:polysaccharide pyruvyl transferase family protein n=1 Tax=Latilactobacillus curvatus TaxID=28038 RepID=UPI0039AF2F43